ncbi:uncharacterized protein CTRU02_206258 [Colletotrichum truncatum]|uniref:Uncharacterized protein n=1 Tax=Colletotrichum truncatum TaxID=5467 RepID=A0ACC3Z6C9_COLTU|nr:uncharacterized protein CTRU02_09903 [Colletotrichum truncatum]KAF6788090.1 hypothetical protein CTRU02_09903 [Colletotrichum truncatum]
MQSPNLFRSLCALFVVLIGAHLVSTSPVAISSPQAATADNSVITPRAGGGWCWPFCNPFNRGLPNTPTRYDFRPPASTARALYLDTPDTQVTLRVETQTTGAVVVLASIGTHYRLPAHAEINVRLLIRNSHFDFNHSNLQIGSETAVVRISPEQAASFRTGDGGSDGSFKITLLYKLGQDL